MRSVWMLQWGRGRCCCLSVCHVVREVEDEVSVDDVVGKRKMLQFVSVSCCQGSRA